MAKDHNESNLTTDSAAGMSPDGASDGASGAGGGPDWGQIWQMPVLLLGLALLLAGLAMVLLPARPRPNYVGALQEATRLINAQKFDDARKKLEAVRDSMDKASKEERGVYYLLSGDLAWGQIQSDRYKYDTEATQKALVKDYTTAKQLGATIDPTRWRRWAMAFVVLGKFDDALATLDQLAGEQPEHRYTVLREIIERRAEVDDGKSDGLKRLLGRFNDEVRHEPDPVKCRKQEIWAASVQARQAIGSDPQGAVKELLVQVAKLGTGDDLAPLQIQLAKAYQQIDELPKARRWYLEAQKSLKHDTADPLNAEALVGLGQVAQSQDPRAALELFSLAATTYPSTPAYFGALVGRADCEARIEIEEQALEHFADAVKLLAAERPIPIRRIRELTDKIHSKYEVCSAKGAYQRALDYLTLLTPLYPKEHSADLDESYVKMLADLAVTHERIAQKRLNDAQAMVVRGEDPADIARMSSSRKQAFQDAAIHFGHAGDLFYQHAQAMTVIDDQAYGASLWNAANDYDRAQMWKRTIEVYGQFVKTRTNDTRRLEAINHLGLAYMADGQFTTAEALFKDLLDHNPRDPEAYRSLVPLARCYVATRKVDDAVRVLRHVVTDHPTITPQSEEYRDALIELGKLLYQQGQYVEAIEEMSMAVDRYGDTQQGAVLRFRLAEAYRQSVMQLDKSLKDPLTQSARAAVESERRARLEQAKVLYSQVVSALEARDPTGLSPVEQLFLRNAYFYQADCAYDLGQFEPAIALYDRAAKRWDNHPASLVALVQIVNAYCELNRIQEARVTNERARAKLKQLPDKAFDDPSLPMTRKHWEDWLKWSSQLEPSTAQASATESK